MPQRTIAFPPTGNILIQRLSAGDRALIAPHASQIVLQRGVALLRANHPLDAVFFPDGATVSLEEPLAEDRAIEIALVGREGMLGWPALLGSASSPHDAYGRTPGGTALRIGAEPLRLACRQSASLSNGLLRFIHVMMVQMSCAIASHLEHSLGRRVARWLLMRHDRLGGDILACHHDEIARCLNVRRASITDQLHLIEGERLVRCTRGRVVVRDRSGLEHFAGAAYGQAEEQYRRLIAPFGKSTSLALC